MKDLNAGFLLDIWQDLKEKRLAPVAVGLVVALIAIPALMMKGEGSASEVPLPLPVSAGTDAAKVVVAEESASGSKLGSYDARDPFKGLHKGTAAPETGSDSGTADAPVVDTGATGSTGSTGTTAPAPPDTSGGSTGGSESPTPVTTPPADAPPVKREPAFYNFRLDLEFGQPGREKRYRSMSRLSFLQGFGVPIALYLGVNEDEKHALFLVYPGLSHQGEGECIPKPTKCNFLSLKVGREHYFSGDDREYRIELRDIKRVKVTKDKKERHVAKAARQSGRSSDAAVTGAAGSSVVEPHDWPLLVDGVG